MTSERRKQIKEAIQIFEYDANGLYRTMGGYVIAKSISVDRKKGVYIANITIGDDLERTSSTYKDCEFPIDIIDKLIKK